MDLIPSPPEALGFNKKRLAEAVRIAAENEIDWPRDLHQALTDGVLDAPPYNKPFGPVESRGAPNGLVLRKGLVAATWGDIHRADFTFSVAKSFLALLAGVAWGEGLIPDLHEPVRLRASDDDFESEQNRDITWHHLLQQTSEWEGTLFDLPDLVDRNRDLDVDGDNPLKGQHRDLHPPGTYWEYNDVRVNRLSLSLMQLFRRPLPEVLAERIMRPLGASEDWRWHGYFNSDVEIDGQRMVSVPGGTHFGGGLCISASDLARMGELVRLDGVSGAQRLLPQTWCRHMLTPCELKPDYGYLWWLNTNGLRMPGVSQDSVFALGAGGNEVWVDRASELVVVVRWLAPERTDTVFGAIWESLG